jgi:hypothetical protein
MPRRFYMQLSTDDLHMLVVPPWFQDALREWIKIPLAHSVPLSACRSCDEWVQVTYHGGHVVFGRNWAQTICKYDLHYDDIMDFNDQAFILKMILYKVDCYTARIYTCPITARRRRPSFYLHVC